MSRPVMVLVLVFMALGLLAGAGCTTLNKEECLAADWQAIGYEDGRRGYPDTRIARHREACADHQVRPKVQAYRQGHEQGLREYCQPQRGYELGLRAGHYRGVCPAELDARFVSAYEYGKSIYFLKRDLYKVEQRLEQAQAELAAVEQQIDQKEGQLISPKGAPAQRRELLHEVHDLSFKKQQILSQLHGLKDHSQQLASNIQQLKHQSPYQQ